MFSSRTTHRDLCNGDYVYWKASLDKFKQWTDDELREYELSELNRVLGLALKTKGYQRLFAEHGVTKNKIRYLDDLHAFPTIGKEDIRRNVSDFTVGCDLDYVTTGGSTGVPFGFYRSKKAFARELASKAYLYNRVGWTEGARQVVFRGLPISTSDRWEFFPEFNELRMSSYDLNDAQMEKYWEAIQKYQPEWVRCYPSSGYLFALWMLENGVRIEGLCGVLCASENLYENQKRIFSRVYGGRLFAHYGNYELTALAGYGVTDDRYHCLRPYGYVELLDGEGTQVAKPGAVGEIVGTSFVQEGTIMFRYKTVDFAVFGSDSSPEGAMFGPVLDRIEGRLQDFVVSATGRLVSMTALNMHDDIFDGLAQFQLEQHEAGLVNFNYVPLHPGKLVDEARIRQRLSPKLGEDFNVIFQRVEIIPATKRGKHRFLVQKLNLSVGDSSVSRLFEK
jgi:phenylacetate-CoA ligase